MKSKIFFLILICLSSCKKQYPSVITLTNECPPQTFINLPSDLSSVLPSSSTAFIAFDQNNWKKIIDIIDSIAIDKKLNNKWVQKSTK